MLGNDFDTPIMHQDLANYSMGPMYMPFIGQYNPYNPYNNTNLLGGTTMPKQLDSDKIEVFNKKENEDKSTFKKALAAIGGLLLIGAIPVIRKGIKNGGVINYIKSLFAKNTAAAPKQPIMPRIKTWCLDKFDKLKNLFNKNASSPQSQAQTPQKSFISKVKDWCADRWTSLKNLVKKRP